MSGQGDYQSEQALDACDVCQHLHPTPSGTHISGDQALDRSAFFTFKRTNDPAYPHGIWTSRIDLFILPITLLMQSSILYDAHNTGSFSDHKELWLHLPMVPQPRYFAHSTFCLPFDFTDTAENARAIEAILAGFNFSGANPFEQYCSLLQQIRDYACAKNRQRQRSLESKINRIRKAHVRLANSEQGAGWIRHHEWLVELEEQAVVLAKTTAIDVQQRAVNIWLHQGNRNQF
ncbi:hypothetical protein COEREDRAFT_12236 [Coemansia reversa NRRL 1564]|uniref:Uncharacterized protein n=1 Tax=Coemansia reversa (strain ATCC 12441 / NRRL 1564) TaxID=763665 RepID=A0A2G5B180_COERN|nr:hypothetical protein COEREDRAFT_12236 [Coemansia reversa NRRL 1564]|eukprot:PIA12761.1 hypothetical protein COEREDRAFT_12236 [Coemansia reversa NRRL 1564]